jgi:hypothetical protein
MQQWLAVYPPEFEIPMCFSWPLIEAQSDLVQVRLREGGEIHVFRQVLPQ